MVAACCSQELEKNGPTIFLTFFVTFEVLMKVEQLKQHLSRACPTRLGTKPRAVFFFQVTEYVTFVKLEPSWVGLPWCDRRAPRNSYDPGCEPLLSYLHGQTWKNVRICWGDVWLSHHVILGRRAKSNFTCGSPCSNVVLVWYSCSASFTEPCSLPSDVKVCWDVFIGVLIIYTIITLTWRIGFDQALLAQLGTIALNLKQRKWNN